MSPPSPHEQSDAGLSRHEVLRFEIVGTIAHAAHFVRANWPCEATKPELDMTSNPMTITFRLDAATIRELQAMLSRAMAIPGPLIESARSLRMMVAGRLVGRVIPEASAVGRGSRAG